MLAPNRQAWLRLHDAFGGGVFAPRAERVAIYIYIYIYIYGLPFISGGAVLGGTLKAVLKDMGWSGFLFSAVAPSGY